MRVQYGLQRQWDTLHQHQRVQRSSRARARARALVHDLTLRVWWTDESGTHRFPGPYAYGTYYDSLHGLEETRSEEPWVLL